MITVGFTDNTEKKFATFDDIFKLKNKLDIVLIDCSDNNLTVIPEELCDLINLEQFHFENNKITAFPQNIDKLNNLWIIIGDNNLITEIPVFITNMIKYGTIVYKL